MKILSSSNLIRKLKYFVDFTRSGSYQKASTISNVSTTAINKSIKDLEEDIGVPLVSNGGQITDDGKYLSERAYDVLRELDRFETACNERRHGSKTMEIAANHVNILYVLPTVIKQLKEEDPNLIVKLRYLAIDDAMERLEKKHIDVFFYPRVPFDVPKGIEFELIRTFTPVVVMPVGHPLSYLSEEDLTIERIAEHNLIRIDPHLITLPMFEEVLARHNFSSSIHLENGDWIILKKLVRAGLGVAMISDIIAYDGTMEGLIARPVTKYFPTMEYGVYHLNPRTSNARRIINTTKRLHAFTSSNCGSVQSAKCSTAVSARRSEEPIDA